MDDYTTALTARVAAHDAREARNAEEAAAARAGALSDAKRYMWNLGIALDHAGLSGGVAVVVDPVVGPADAA